ncbi:uncharacterized protein LOC114520107 [Dendronephthya gigantea]|uniref:uncharacterized protein LOC114520107 n=1 Tax=Dendronephthya gigantea TaxID=151771 RepID=UPI00106BF9A2|nr:uncharacterized protein LOC114520107 [Dendronephthya gigantea]
MYKSSFQSSRLVERRYQRLLEDEQKCLARNKKLLEDIDRLEEQMEYFSHECKHDEEKLDHAKDKFMQYVKSVYPKWSVDLKRWQESRNKSKNPIAQSDQNRTSPNPVSVLHSTPRKNQLGSTSHNPHTLEDTGTKYKGSLRYPRDTNGSYMDKTDHDKDKMRYPEKRTSFMNGSLRDRTDLSWDEMGFRKGYSGNDMRYPWDGTMVYPQHSPHGMYSHPVHPYFVPMPAYGMPRWSTPGYHDPWSTSYAHGTSFEDYSKDGRQGVSFERQKHSYERDERPQEHETLQRDVLPNSGNRDSSSHFYAENLPDNGGYPTGQYSDRKQDLLGSSMREVDTQQLSRGEVRYNRSTNVKASQDHSEDGRSHDQEKINRQAPRKEIKDGLSQHSDVNNEKYMQKKNNPEQDGNFNEELTNHRTMNSGDFDKQHQMRGREYFVEPVQDARLMQLRGEGSEFEGGEVINTDSISLPTIHQYEGDPGEIFSDISSSEPANQDDSRRVESKHSEVGGNLNNQPPSSKVEIEQHSDRDYDGQVKHGPGLIGDDRGQEKNDEIKSNVSAKNKVHKDGGDKRLLTSEVSESKTSVVEDLIGDDVSDFEVSDDSEHSEVGFENNAPVALASGNVEGETTGLVGHKIEDICDQNANEKKAKQTGVMPESMNEGEYSSFPNDALAGYEETETRIEDKAPEKDVAGNTAIATNNLSNKSAKQQNEVAGSVVAPLRNETENLKEDEVPTETSEDRLHEQNVDVDGFSRENEPTHPSEEFIEEELEKTHDDVSIGQSKIVEDDHEDEEITNDSKRESKESGVAALVNEKGEDNVKKSHRKFLSGDEKSKSGVLEELSLSSVESSSESSPVQRNNASKKKVVDSNISYSEDFEEKSISLTQSAVYQKMLSTVHVSDEGEDFEEEFLEGTMSEANTTAQSTHNPEQTLPDARTSQAKLPAKSSRPTLSLFNSAERDDFGSSFGKEEAGLSASWQSSDGTLSPPLSPDTQGYVPSVAVGGKMGNKQKEERGSVPPVGKTTDGNTEKEKIEPKPQDSNTKARIQAGFWNQSDSESEVDLQVSHGGQNNDANDDDDFDFYS